MPSGGPKATHLQGGEASQQPWEPLCSLYLRADPREKQKSPLRIPNGRDAIGRELRRAGPGITPGAGPFLPRT